MYIYMYINIYVYVYIIWLYMSILIKQSGALKHSLKQVHRKRLKGVGGAGVDLNSTEWQ